MTNLALSPEQWEAIRAFQAKEIESLATDDEFARRASLTSHYSRIGEWLSPELKGRVLEAGCGPGRYVALLSKLGFSVVGIDPFPKFPTWKLIESHCQVEFHDGVFAESLPFPDGSFDHVACMAALLYFRDPHRALAEFRRVVKPGGRLVVRSVNRRNLYRIVRGRHLDPAARNHYTMRELVGLLSDAGFIVHKSFSYGFYPPYLEAWWWYLVNGIISTDVQTAMSLLTPPPLRIDLTLFCTAPSSGASRGRDERAGRDQMSHLLERNVQVVKVNERLRPYRAERDAVTVRFTNRGILGNVGARLWYADDTGFVGSTFLTKTDILSDGAILDVIGADLFDFSVGILFVRVREHTQGREGYLPLSSFVFETDVIDDRFWTADDPKSLSNDLVVRMGNLRLYSGMRLVSPKIDQALNYFDQMNKGIDSEPPHPLYAASEAHRLCLWALDGERDDLDRQRVVQTIDSFFQRRAFPALHRIASGAVSWPYLFDFDLPWVHLKAPWYSGYANAALAGAAACMFQLTGNHAYRDLAIDAVGFLRLPMDQGGALYREDGYSFIAEYAYRSPPAPNYRVFDGELMSLPYLHNVALILRDAQIGQFFIELASSMAAVFHLFSPKPGLPRNSMDGADAPPTYMWQLWIVAQILGNILKDHQFSRMARAWRNTIPPEHTSTLPM